MTRAQEIISRWVDTQFIKGCVKMTFPDDASVIITDRKGDSLALSCNLYGDILDRSSGKILAKSDLKHDISAVGYSLPNSWTNFEYSGINE